MDVCSGEMRKSAGGKTAHYSLRDGADILVIILLSSKSPSVFNTLCVLLITSSVVSRFSSSSF